MSQPSAEPTDARYRLLVHSILDHAIFMLDPEGRVQTWNPGAQNTKGYLAEEVIGQHLSLFYPQSDRDLGKPQALLKRAADQGVAHDQGWRVRKDGSRFWADVTITRVLDAAGRLLGFSKITRDITARREAEEAIRQGEERFRVMVQSVKDHAIFMLDPQGNVATWNAGAERINGYLPGEIIGKHFSAFYLPQDVASGKCERELQVAERDGQFEEEGWRVRKDGGRFWASVVIEPLRALDGSLLGFAKVTRDLTERRAADEERLQLLQTQEALRLRDEFLSIASHELKTPLTALLLQLQTLLQSVQDADEKLRRRAERAYRSGDRLTDLVEMLLDVSRIATGKFTLEKSPTDLGAILADIVERFDDQAARQRCVVSLRMVSPVLGRWDGLRLDQVITNLLANALKYAAGHPIDLVGATDGANGIIEVRDQGPGISRPDQERIFQRFERASSPRHFGGLGLGLYVARQICEAHGGTLTLSDVQPHGVCFRVTLPLEPAAEVVP